MRLINRFFSFTVNNSSHQTRKKVVIGGVRWATCNVDAPGTFASSPEKIGMLYQWGKKPVGALKTR